MVTVPELKTARLTLRPVMPSDAPAIVEGVGDWDVAKWLAVVPHPYTAEDAREFIEVIAPAAEGLWAIDDGALAGLSRSRARSGTGWRGTAGGGAMRPRPGGRWWTGTLAGVRGC